MTTMMSGKAASSCSAETFFMRGRTSQPIMRRQAFAAASMRMSPLAMWASSWATTDASSSSSSPSTSPRVTTMTACERPVPQAKAFSAGLSMTPT